MANRAVVVDGREAERARAAATLEAEGIQVVGTCQPGLECRPTVERLQPDYVFVAFEPPLPRLVNLIAEMTLGNPNLAVVAYTSDPSVVTFQQAVRAGARYVLPAPLGTAEVAKVVEMVTGQRSRHWSQNRLPRGRVLAVVGQKGGIGKTTLSTNLAATLAGEGRSSVVVIDFDATFGDVALALDITGKFTAAEVAFDAKTLDRETFRNALVEHESGAYVLPAPAHVGEWFSVAPEQMDALVELAASMFDHVIIDTPGAFNDTVAAALAIADHALIVTSLELTSVKNTSLLLDLLREEQYPEERVLVVVNNTAASTGMAATDVANSVRTSALWEVPFDRAMAKAHERGRPVVMDGARSPGASSIRALGMRILVDPGRVNRRSSVRARSRAASGDLSTRLRRAMARVPRALAPAARLKANVRD